ncbi:TPA: hypothetical protein IRO79_003938 [Escherichia coli]|nr:hypothetical protein [Escherichia coli]
MPEGPEIRRAADNLEAAIKGKPLTDVWFAFPQLKTYQSQLIGQHVTHVETRGKALLTHFSNDLTLYSHNQLYGVWRVVDTGEEPQTTRVLRVEILWQVGLTGNHKAKDLNAAQLDALAHALLEIPRFSYATRGQVDENKHHGALFRFKVFHRDGELCERCGGIIEKTTLSSRPFYWCPGCQH